jgi:phosphopantothenoylcysteine decarboxylase/phosphopantothenate--cysteine ligase
MADAVFKAAEQAHIIIKAAAVGDYRPRETAPHKIKKIESETVLTLIKTQDILKTLGTQKQGQFLAGFAAETRDLRENAEKKLAEKNLDMIVGNLVNHPGSGFGTDTNHVTLFYRDGSSETLDAMEKEAAAHVILDRIAERMP